MISEQITVTTTYTTIQSLLETARGVAAGTFAPVKCVGIMLRYDLAETASISLADSGTATGAIILKAQTESLVYTSFKQFDISKAKLKSSAGNIVVHMIIEQKLI